MRAVVQRVTSARVCVDDRVTGAIDRGLLVLVGGGVLVVSQFTLYGDVRNGRRPSFDDAAAPAPARQLYEHLVRELRTLPIAVATGEFQALMRVELVNDGPVTILVDSRKHF